MMANVITVKPAKGVLVRDPISMTHIPSAGTTVEWSRYWQKQIDQGNVLLVTVKPIKKEDR